MGLDMYLTAKWHLSTYNMKDAKLIAGIKALDFGVSDLEPIEPTSVGFEAMYWRKANGIHAWFVANVQDGTDDCKEYYVCTEQLTTLRDICSQVIADQTLAEKLLPGHTGFFFGGTDIDEYYMDALSYTVERLDVILASPKDDLNFYYQSSW